MRFGIHFNRKLCLKFVLNISCYNFLISIHYALQIVNAFGEYFFNCTVRVCDWEYAV